VDFSRQLSRRRKDLSWPVTLFQPRRVMNIYNNQTQRQVSGSKDKVPELVDSLSQSDEARSSTPPAEAPAPSRRARLTAALQNLPLAILGLGALITLAWVALLIWVLISFIKGLT
jgi:hypothetical protein